MGRERDRGGKEKKWRRRLKNKIMKIKFKRRKRGWKCGRRGGMKVNDERNRREDTKNGNEGTNAENG